MAIFSTEEVHPSERVSYWDVNVIRGFAKLKVPRNEPFNGSLTVGEIGSIGVSRIESDPFEIQRSRKEIAHSHADDYFIHLQCAGQSTHLQGDCETRKGNSFWWISGARSRDASRRVETYSPSEHRAAR